MVGCTVVLPVEGTIIRVIHDRGDFIGVVKVATYMDCSDSSVVELLCWIPDMSYEHVYLRERTDRVLTVLLMCPPD